VNGSAPDTTTNQELGYLRIEREWQSGDVVVLSLEMPVERIYAHPSIRQNAGKVALQRGPLVFCFEQVDQSAPLAHLRLPPDAVVEAQFDAGLLGGVTVLKAKALVESDAGWEQSPYQTHPPVQAETLLTAVPYFTWDNREPGAMMVWVAER
jgi:uncharacterized protein